MSKNNNNYSSLFSHSYSLNESKSNNHHVSTTTPVITMRRLSKLSLSALNDDNNEELDSSNNSNLFNNNYSARSDPHYDNQFHPSTTTLHPHHPLSIPISSSPIQYTHHGHSLTYSTSPSTSILSQQQQQPLLRRSSIQYHHGLAGSYEESLLSGRMSTLQPSKPITFHAQIGVLGYGHCKPSLKCPQHRSIYFPAFFYDNHDNTNDNHSEDMSIFNSQQPQQHTSTIPPYVGTIDLTMDEEKRVPSPGYRIPSKGQLQIAIKNPNKHLVKLFLIPYDVSSMPRNTKTFLRQTSYLTTNTATSSSSSSVLKHAIHIQLCRTDKNRVYLYKQIRVVFTNRCMDAREQYRVVCEGPKEPVYVPL
ncbi:hypothetical protein BJ944DRAFT_268810 [Cunninghamella echinulata]|nr:hypothetical protein BJ944DRAFT_268810 [Cunninghamella echinulata]